MKKVITYGTFDLFHIGHYNIIKRAKELGDYLIVGVTSESYDLERGKLNVKDSLTKRMQNVKNTGLADEIIIEEYQGQKIRDALKYDVDILVVGSDWIGKFDYMKQYCEVIYLERTKNISSTLLREENYILNLGIMTNEDTDDDIIMESKYVSGIHAKSNCAPELSQARAFFDKYQLHECTDDYDQFLKDVDVVYLKMRDISEDNYVKYMEKAIVSGNTLICNLSHIKNLDVAKNILNEATKSGVLVCEDIVTAYVRAFEQMIWYLKGGVIGDIIGMNINISKQKYEYNGKDDREILYLILFMMTRIIGTNVKKISTFMEEERRYYSVFCVTDKGELKADIGATIKLNDSLEVIGSKGRLFVPDDWWRMRYFKIIDNETNSVKRYSYNFDGNGFKYVLIDVMSMIETHRKEPCKIFYEESLSILDILNQVDRSLCESND